MSALAIIVDVRDHITQAFSWWQFVTPGLAAVAAGASWASVWTSRRGQSEADRPQLVFYIVPVNDDHSPTPIAIRIENVGQGVALMPGFTLLSGNGKGASHLIPETMDHGDEVRYGLPFLTVEGAAGLVFCEDRRNNIHVWSNKNTYKLYKRNKRGRAQITPRQMFADLLSDQEIDVDGVDFVVATRLA